MRIIVRSRGRLRGVPIPANENIPEVVDEIDRRCGPGAPSIYEKKELENSMKEGFPPCATYGRYSALNKPGEDFASTANRYSEEQ